MPGRICVALAVIALTAAGCGGAAPRFPADVQQALVDQPMRRMETERLELYYPAHRAEQARRFASHAERCAGALQAAALVDNRFARKKLVVVMPEVAFNNAFVAPPVVGYEDVAVVPTWNSLDFATEFGLPPDPRFVGCHELVHYVHQMQIDGLWATLDTWFGHVMTPQLGFDSWFFEGLATHYEAALQPGAGRPRWPVFTGMFAAAYAGGDVGGGDLSELGRQAHVGHNYLVGTMFVDFLARTYGERPLWITIAAQARSQAVVTSVGGRFEDGFGKSLGDLLGEFARWTRATYPVRHRPAGQRALRTLGGNARYARGRDGSEAWVVGGPDQETRLVVRDGRGGVRADQALVDLLPPHRLVIADPLLVSGLSLTADGGAAYLTALDLSADSQTTRLLRVDADGDLAVMTSGLGPGLTVSPDGATYYFAEVDGDRWHLAGYDLATGQRRRLTTMSPGQFVLTAQASADGRRLAASVWNGARFVVWELDAATGARGREHAGATGPLYDPAFLDDGRLVYLQEVDGRFQLTVVEPAGPRVITDVPYAALAPRPAGPTIRFLNRDGWSWTLDEITAPEPVPPAPAAAAAPVAAAAPAAPAAPVAAAAPAAPAAAAAPAAVAAPVVAAAVAPVPAATPAPSLAPPGADPAPYILSDTPYRWTDHLFTPSLHAPTLMQLGPGVPLVGVVLAGGDRLGLQRWAATGLLQFGPADRRTHGSGAISYSNTLLAPWTLGVDASWLRWDQSEAFEGDDTIYVRSRRSRDGALSFGRSWRGVLAAALSGIVTDDFDQLEGEAALRRTLAGGGLDLAWGAADGTRHAGTRRALALIGSGAYYPAALSTLAGQVVDVGATALVVVPVPATRRHAVALTGRGRAVVGDGEADLLEVGGAALFSPLYTRASATPPVLADDLRLPPALRFSEPVRGFEDLVVRTDRAVIGHATWTYPLILDRGLATTWFLPATFLRQLDLELFAAGWRDLVRRQDHAAAGAALTLRLSLFQLPIALQYQLGRRLTDDEALTHTVGVGPDL